MLIFHIPLDYLIILMIHFESFQLLSIFVLNIFKFLDPSQLHALVANPECVYQLPDLLLHGEQVQDGADGDGARLDQGEGAVRQHGHDR